MNNFIEHWDYAPPTQEGYYLMCYGDIITQANVWPIKIVEIRGQLHIFDTAGERSSVEMLSSSYQWAKLIYSPTEIKELKK